MEYSEEDFLLISGIQHFAFCPRQWALIHIEKQWAENFLTVEGELAHYRVHDVLLDEKRASVKHSRGVNINSRELGVVGSCDMVEFRDDGQIVIIEYKRGEPKEHNADILQLTLQAMCLEEMVCSSIDYGFIYYAKTRHRLKVEFTSILRAEVKKSLEEMHRLYERAYTPKAKAGKHCNPCSLKEICLPSMLKILTTAKDYNKKHVEEVLNEETT